jgi:hypothetical protein
MVALEALRDLAGSQHGVFSIEQAQGLRVPRYLVEGELGRGRLVRLRTGVYGFAGAPRTWEQAIAAAVLAAGPDASASHTTAGVIWGFPNLEREITEVSTGRPRRARIRGVHVHRTVAFLADEHTVRDAIPVTTVARTLVDLSARLSAFQLGVITDDALRRNTLTLTQLRRCVAGLRPGPGRRTSRIHEVLSARDPGYDPGESDLELRVLRAIAAAGLAEPVQQHWVRLPRRRCRLDLAYPEPTKLAIEVDGFGPHGTRTAFDTDRARANDLVVGGWTVVRFTSASSDDQIGTTVAAALAQLGRFPAA